ncbi:MAG: hypothetical protein HUU23_11630 [Caldilineales bacterium]|nr:hypothetical protein [Caldilineales bacterium]
MVFDVPQRNIAGIEIVDEAGVVFCPQIRQQYHGLGVRPFGQDLDHTGLELARNVAQKLPRLFDAEGLGVWQFLKNALGNGLVAHQRHQQGHAIGASAQLDQVFLDDAISGFDLQLQIAADDDDARL